MVLGAARMASVVVDVCFVSVAAMIAQVRTRAPYPLVQQESIAQGHLILVATMETIPAALATMASIRQPSPAAVHPAAAARLATTKRVHARQVLTQLAQAVQADNIRFLQT